MNECSHFLFAETTNKRVTAHRTMHVTDRWEQLGSPVQSSRWPVPSSQRMWAWLSSLYLLHSGLPHKAHTFKVSQSSDIRLDAPAAHSYWQMTLPIPRWQSWNQLERRQKPSHVSSRSLFGRGGEGASCTTHGKSPGVPEQTDTLVTMLVH